MGAPFEVKWKSRLLFRESIFTAVAFTAALYVYYIVVIWGVQEEFRPGPLRDYLLSRAVHVELIGSGVLFGGLLGMINRVTEGPRLRQRPLAQVVALRTVLYLVGLAVVGGVVLLIFATLILPLDALVAIYQAITVRQALSFVFWMVLIVAAINLALEVERVLGPGNLWRLFVGRYRRPREEERVFLFLDLEGSTSTAEALGHVRYSELLQECYRDLTQVVLEHEAAIYQYVGDEVVMSWPIGASEASRLAAVRTFFDYQEALRAKSESYQGHYGVTPTFRGGIAVGPVTVIEVGDVKREVVYHGDVLNTAARLLDTCKTRNESLLVSRSVGEAVQGDSRLQEGWHGEVPLRGKREPVEAYSLRSVGSWGWLARP